MLANLLKKVGKAATKAAAKSEASAARNAIYRNPKMTGDKEKTAIDKINQVENQVIKKASTDKVNRKKKDIPEKADRDRKLATARTQERKRQEDIRNTQRTSNITKGRPVSKADIEAANTAADFRAMQIRIGDLPEGIRKKMMQDILDRQKAMQDKKLADEADTASRKSAQSASDRKKFKGYTPANPFEGMMKGGMAKRKNYAKGGYANCGASMKPTQKATMMCGGAVKKKK